MLYEIRDFGVIVVYLALELSRSMHLFFIGFWNDSNIANVDATRNSLLISRHVKHCGEKCLLPCSRHH